MQYTEVGRRRHPALDYGQFHPSTSCVVDIVMGPTALWVFCRTCQVAAQLDAISRRIDTEGSKEVRPVDSSPAEPNS